jgi:hypothetical protein
LLTSDRFLQVVQLLVNIWLGYLPVMGYDIAVVLARHLSPATFWGNGAVQPGGLPNITLFSATKENDVLRGIAVRPSTWVHVDVLSHLRLLSTHREMRHDATLLPYGSTCRSMQLSMQDQADAKLLRHLLVAVKGVTALIRRERNVVRRALFKQIKAMRMALIAKIKAVTKEPATEQLKMQLQELMGRVQADEARMQAFWKKQVTEKWHGCASMPQWFYQSFDMCSTH